MFVLSRSRWKIGTMFAIVLVLGFTISSAVFASRVSSTLLQVSSDRYTNSASQHSTEVVDAEGIIAGTDDIGTAFSFRIISSQPTPGGMTPPPGAFHIDVKGVLKTPAGSCTTDAHFSGTLLIPE